MTRILQQHEYPVSPAPLGTQAAKAVTAILAVCWLASLAGCSSTSLQQPISGNSGPGGPTGYQQLDKGLTQTFVVCQHCLQPTRKTLWTAEASADATEAGKPVSQDQPTPVNTGTKHAATQPAEVITNATVHFKSNSSALSDQAQDELRQFCDQPMSLDGVMVTGFTDATGTKARNQELAHQRAEQTSLFLKRCIPKHDGASVPVHEASRGNCCYVDSNATQQGRQRNRRAEISAEVNPSRIKLGERPIAEHIPPAQQTNQPQSSASEAMSTELSGSRTASHE